MLTRKLARIVEAGVMEHGALGGGDAADHFQQQCMTLQQRSNRFYLVAVAMTVVLFVVMLLLMVVLRHNAAVLAGLGTICGTGMFALIGMLTRISKEVVQVGLLLVLATRLPPEDVVGLLRVLDERNKRDRQG